MHASYSQISRAEDCLRKFAFGVCDKLYEPQRKQAAAGDTVHALNEAYVRYGLPFPDTRLGRLCELAIDHLPTRADAPETEVSGEFRYGPRHTLTYRADVMWVGPAMPVITDYKTVEHFGWVPTPAKLRMDLQVNINCYGAMQRYGDFDAALAFWIYYRRPKEDDPSDVGEIMTVESVIEIENARRVLRARQGILDQMEGLKQRPTRALNVVGNTASCRNYGGCWYRHKCDPERFMLSEDGKKSVERGPEVMYREPRRAPA